MKCLHPQLLSLLIAISQRFSRFSTREKRCNAFSKFGRSFMSGNKLVCTFGRWKLRRLHFSSHILEASGQPYFFFLKKKHLTFEKLIRQNQLYFVLEICYKELSIFNKRMCICSYGVARTIAACL